MSRVASGSQLAEQYKDETNLSARQRLYRFRDPRATPWPRWVFEQLDLPANARVLEVGCGTGKNTALLAGIARTVHAIDYSRQ